MPVLSRCPFFLLLALLCFTPAQAQSIFNLGSYGESHVIEIPLGVPYSTQSLLPFSNRGFHFANSYSLLYLVNLLPGEYTLGLTYPAMNRRVAVSLFDRWPYDSWSSRIDLPMGPTVRTNYKKIEYRWHMAISPLSTSTTLYIIVEVPPSNMGFAPFPHTVFIMGPPSGPLSTMARGVTFLEGPTNLVLSGEREAVAYIVERPSLAIDQQPLPVFPIPGDLVQNGWFKDGLNHWSPHRNYAVSSDVNSFSLQEQGLRIASAKGQNREGILQRIDADVSGAQSLILRADVKVTRQTLGGTGPDGRQAPVAIAVCYEDINGKEHCRDTLFWRGFFALAPEGPNQSVNGQKVPEGVWYRYIYDLMQLDPKPKSIKFISLEGSGWPEREGWVREVHLIKGGEKP